MNYRYSKTLDKQISSLGFGGWQLGNTEFWGDMSFKEGVVLVKKAISLGVNFFDTAPGYSSGMSESIIGEAIRGDRENVVVNTKFGHNADSTSDFSIENIERSINLSLGRLQTTYLDSIILHNPEMYILEGKTDHFKELDRLKKMGKIRAYGVSVDRLDELVTILDNIEVDVIEVMFNVIHQEVTKVFDEIAKRGILLVVKVPLDSGWLTGKYNESSKFEGIRNRWNKETIINRSKIIKRIKEIVKDDNLVKHALSFILSFKAVTTVIPGVKNLSQLESNITSAGFKMEEDIKQQLIVLYDNYIKGVATPW
jgi:aryl-alcohol dehydrogenase-like predicted oxidoreductase